MRSSVMAAMSVVIALGLVSRVTAQDKPQAPQPGMFQAGELAKVLNLTPEQKQQVETILQQARAQAAQAEGPQAKQQVRHAAVEQIEKVLTDEQKAKFAHFVQERRQQAQAEGQPGNPLLAALKQLNLTDAQKAQVEQILKQARLDAEKATDQQAKQQIRESAMRKIRLEVLTDAQRQQLQQNMANRQPGAGQQRPHEGPRSPASRPA